MKYTGRPQGRGPRDEDGLLATQSGTFATAGMATTARKGAAHADSVGGDEIDHTVTHYAYMWSTTYVPEEEAAAAFSGLHHICHQHFSQLAVKVTGMVIHYYAGKAEEMWHMLYSGARVGLFELLRCAQYASGTTMMENTIVDYPCVTTVPVETGQHVFDCIHEYFQFLAAGVVNMLRQAGTPAGALDWMTQDDFHMLGFHIDTATWYLLQDETGPQVRDLPFCNHPWSH